MKHATNGARYLFLLACIIAILNLAGWFELFHGSLWKQVWAIVLFASILGIVISILPGIPRKPVQIVGYVLLYIALLFGIRAIDASTLVSGNLKATSPNLLLQIQLHPFRSMAFFFTALALLLGANWYVALVLKKRTRFFEQRIIGSTGYVIGFVFLGVIMGIVGFGFRKEYVQTNLDKEAPARSEVVQAIVQQGNAEYYYANGHASDTLFAQVNYPVRIDVRTIDYPIRFFAQGFSFPDKLEPLHTHSFWFIPRKAGVFKWYIIYIDVTGVTYRQHDLVVWPSRKYSQWLGQNTSPANIEAKQLEESAALILKKQGCKACHSVNGTKMAGPTFKNLFGAIQQVETIHGVEEITVDESYIRESILSPDTKITLGYPSGMMLSYQGRISDDEVNLIIKYLETIGAGN